MMRRYISVAIRAGVAFVVGTVLLPPVEAQRPARSAADNAAVDRQVPLTDAARVVDRYCVTCHNARLKTAGLVLDTTTLGSIAANAATWEKVIARLHSGTMPPAGAPRPDAAAYRDVTAAMEQALDRAALLSPNPGRTPALHRLNRAEYRNAIRDILALDMDVAALLPSDSGSYGFDNIAGVLSVSPALLDRYMSAASKVSAIAVGRAVPPTSEMFRVAADGLQDDRMPGLPFGTRGGTSIRYTFPQDGEYELRLRLGRNQTDDIAGLAEPSQIDIGIDGEVVHSFTVGGRRPRVAPPPPPQDVTAAAPPQPGGKPARGDFAPAAGRGAAPPAPPAEAADARLHVRVPVKAGPRTLTVTFVKRTGAYAETKLNPFFRVESGQGGESRFQPYLTSVMLSGPFNAVAPDHTPSRDRIFICRPASERDEAACARRVLTSLARRAYRRPPSTSDMTVLLEFFARGRRGGTFDAGIEMAVRRLLVDPQFLFRVERDPDGASSGRPYRISDLELASRLSFFLWSSGPDEELLALAEQQRLRNPDVLARQVTRMLADARAEALVANFAGQWLYLRNVPSLDPNDALFPDFDDTLRQAMRTETELFVASIVRENRSVLTFLDADYTFVNERLARHYGLPNVYGADFRRVPISDPNRGGLLGQASILAVTSEPTRTSPVRRGKWVLENLLGAPPPPPPPDVPALEEPASGSTRVLSMREQMEAHRKNPACASCHRVMDPIGFALERFDALGRWREGEPWMLTPDDQKWRRNEADRPIDGSGALPDGTMFDGPAGLKRALLSHPEQFVATLTEKLLIYALGRGVEPFDRPAIRAIVRQASRDDMKFSALVMGVVSSTPFQMRMSAQRSD